MAITIFGHDQSPRVFAPLIVAAASGVEVKNVSVAPAKGETTPEYDANFPFKKIPGLQDGDFYLFECIPVIEYLAAANGDKAKLLGQSAKETALVRQWLSWTNMELLVSIATWFIPRRGLKPFQKNLDADAEAAVKKNFAALEQVLASRTFLVGERITAADIFLASAIRRGSEFVLDKSFVSSYPNVFRHYRTVANQEVFTKTVGAPHAVLDAPVDPPKAPAKEKAPKKEAAAPAPKAAPKPKKEEKDDEDDDMPAAPKAKHPCEALGAPKSFPFDEWKRQYSNNDTPVAIEWLSKNLSDPSDYSFWRATYKYPAELTQTFMSANLIGGFHNRLEGSRKFLFGSAAVYGKSNDSAIQGVYMIRGSDPKPVFEVAPDFESYDFSPLDFSKDRELISQVWSWEGEFDGKPIADGCAKIFK